MVRVEESLGSRKHTLEQFDSYSYKFKTDKNARKRYQELVIGDLKLVSLMKHEFITLFFGPIPSAAGLFLRKYFYRYLFKEVGANAVFGRSIVVRHGGKISLGRNVLVDDYCVLSARGTEKSAIRLGDDVSVARNSILSTRDGVIEIGENTSVGSFCRIGTISRVRIGKNVLVSSYCYIGGGNHRFDRLDVPIVLQGMYSRGGVEIGENVWLGAGVKVLDGVTVGKNSIIGAGSVVTKDIPESVIAYGVPAKVARQRE